MDPLALGRYLRETRESRELTLEDAASTLHIRPHILESFEQGVFSVVSSEVQLRGFLGNYARYLGLNDEQIISYYLASQQTQERNRRPKRRRRRQDYRPDIPIAPRKITDTPPALPVVTVNTLADQRDVERDRRSTLLRTLFLGAGGFIMMALIGFFLTQLIDLEPLLNPPTETPEMTSTATDDSNLILAPSATFTSDASLSDNTDEASENAIVATPTLLFVTGAGVNVELTITQRMWIRVLVDDVLSYEGLVTPGEFLRYEATGGVSLTSSNAAGMDITLNGIFQELDAVRGQRVDLQFSETGMIADLGVGMPPSPTWTPSPTATIPPTETPVPTAGPSPTPTLTPTATATLTATIPPTMTLAPTQIPSQTSTPSITPTASDTPIPSASPVPSRTPTPTQTPSPTLSSTPTAILPIRATRTDATPFKD